MFKEFVLKFYDIEFMSFMKQSLLKDFDNWKFHRNREIFVNNTTFFRCEERGVLTTTEISYTSEESMKNMLGNYPYNRFDVKSYEFKKVERYFIKRWLKMCFDLKEQKRIRDMDSVKNDIICGLTVDKV